MAHLGIDMIPAYSPEARGRSERMFGTHQDRLVKELAAEGITTMEAANRDLEEVYRPAFNAEFARPAREEGTAFVPLLDIPLTDILCEQFVRTVGKDNCCVTSAAAARSAPRRFVRSGQFNCYETGQFYLLTTSGHHAPDTMPEKYLAAFPPLFRFPW